MRGARHRSLQAARLAHQARPQEQPHEREHAFIDDPPSDLTNDQAVWKAVKARLDVRLDDPLVGVGCEAMDLGDRVLCPAAGPVGVARSVEAALEDRLHDELEGHLRDTVLERWDPEATRPAIAFGNQSLADRQRPERPRLQLAVQLPKELLHATRFDMAASRGINTGCA